MTPGASWQVLIITEAGGQLSKTPTYGLEENQETNIVDITIDTKGAAIIKQHTELSGPSHDYYRYYSNNASKEELEEMFLEDSGLPSFKIEKLQITNDDQMPKSTIDFHINVKRYASKAGRRDSPGADRTGARWFWRQCPRTCLDDQPFPRCAAATAGVVAAGRAQGTGRHGSEAGH